MVLGKLPVPGRPTLWMTVRQGPIVLASRCGWVSFGNFTLILLTILSLFLPLVQGDGPMYTEILPQRAVKPKTTNQPTKHRSDGCLLSKADLAPCAYFLFARLPMNLFSIYSAFTGVSTAIEDCCLAVFVGNLANGLWRISLQIFKSIITLHRKQLLRRYKIGNENLMETGSFTTTAAL